MVFVFSAKTPQPAMKQLPEKLSDILSCGRQTGAIFGFALTF